MKIAVTYENGEVFQHFGKTECFKLYEAEDGSIVSSELLNTDGTGHEALADFLAQRGVSVVICGGLGGGAQAALDEAGIAVFSGAEGGADAAVEAFLRGELVSAGRNCSHHEEEAGGGCGGNCGSCGGCHHAPDFDGPNVGRTCLTHYRGTLNDGTQFDSSYERGEPLEFVCGAGMMIHGFDKAVATMEVGQIVDVHLTPEEAYGPVDPYAIFTVELSQLEGAVELQAGEQVILYDDMNRPIPVKVVAIDEKTITLDANHELAGQELNFRIELVDVI